MNKENLVWMAAGGLMGLCVAFYDVDVPQNDECKTYKVASERQTAYVLTPPPPIIRPMACPPAPECKKDAEEKTDVFVNNAETATGNEPKARRHHHRRYRRYWR